MLEYIHIRNFRCYESADWDLKPGINLLIGDNASGKTSMLLACRYVLGSWFAGYSDENTKMDSPQNRDFYSQQSNGIFLPPPNVRIYFRIRKDSISAIQANGKKICCDENEYWIGKNSKKNSRALLSGIRELKNYSHMLYKDTSMVLPLFVSYSTRDIHSKVKITMSKFREYQHLPSFGYYRCLDADGLYPYWKTRMLVLKETDMPMRELEIVKEATLRVLGTSGCNIIDDIYIRPMKREVYYKFVDGRIVASAMLSDGYLRLVSIVTDLAFRCALLNGAAVKSQSVLDETPGVVLLDEMDEHLHPSLQSSILTTLSKSFPKVQFIVSTHAPMVMTDVESNDRNIVYKLSYSTDEGYSHKMINTYGLDASTIISRYLNLSPRNESVQLELDKLEKLLDEEKVSEAKEQLRYLKEQFADSLPELAHAESLITYLDDDLDQ